MLNTFFRIFRFRIPLFRAIIKGMFRLFALAVFFRFSRVRAGEPLRHIRRARRLDRESHEKKGLGQGREVETEKGRGVEIIDLGW